MMKNFESYFNDFLGGSDIFMASFNSAKNKLIDFYLPNKKQE